MSMNVERMTSEKVDVAGVDAPNGLDLHKAKEIIGCTVEEHVHQNAVASGESEKTEIGEVLNLVTMETKGVEEVNAQEVQNNDTVIVITDNAGANVDDSQEEELANMVEASADVVADDVEENAGTGPTVPMETTMGPAQVNEVDDVRAPPSQIRFEDTSNFAGECPQAKTASPEPEERSAIEGIAERVKSRARGTKRIRSWEPTVPVRVRVTKRPKQEGRSKRTGGGGHYRVIEPSESLRKPETYSQHKVGVGLRMDMSSRLGRKSGGARFKFLCNTCTFEADAADRLAEHIWNSHRFVCRACPFTASTRSDLLEHELFMCPAHPPCSAKARPTHLDVVTEPDCRMYLLDNFKPIAAHPPIQSRLFACDHCAYVTTNEKHAVEHGAELGRTQFRCTKCHHTSSTKRAHNEHREHGHSHWFRVCELEDRAKKRKTEHLPTKVIIRQCLTPKPLIPSLPLTDQTEVIDSLLSRDSDTNNDDDVDPNVRTYTFRGSAPANLEETIRNQFVEHNDVARSRDLFFSAANRPFNPTMMSSRPPEPVEPLTLDDINAIYNNEPPKKQQKQKEESGNHNPTAPTSPPSPTPSSDRNCYIFGD